MEATLARLKALADPTRWQLMQILSRFPDAQAISDPRCSLEHGVCACHLEERLNLSAPTISHHLRILREANLVEMVRLGKWTYYRTQIKVIESLQLEMQNLGKDNRIDA